MASSNPVSPKVFAAGIGSILFPAVVYIVSLVLDNLSLISGLPPWSYGLAATIGASLASYLQKDGLRLPTLDKDQVAKLPDPELDNA